MKIEEIIDKYPNDQILSSNRKSLLIFEEQRGSRKIIYGNIIGM